MDNGTSRDTVRNAFYESAEFKQLCKKNGIVDKKNRYPKSCGCSESGRLGSESGVPVVCRHEVFQVHGDSCSGNGILRKLWIHLQNRKLLCYGSYILRNGRELGYDAKQISGSVPLRSGGYGPHSWVEIEINGTTYVFDPDFTNETKRNGYQITYGQSGTWRYNRGSVMNWKTQGNTAQRASGDF